MGTITTTTFANPLIWPSNTLIDRDAITGYLYAMVRATTSNTYEVWRSINNGGAWTLILSTVRANVSELGSIFVHHESPGYMHWCYRTNESGEDRIYYRVTNLGTTPAWTPEKLVASPANGVHPGSMDLTVVGAPSGTYVAIAVGLTVGAQIGLQLYAVFIDRSTGNQTVNHGLISGNRQFLVTGSGRIGPSIDIEHTGNAKGSGTPNLWVAWGRTDVYSIKAPWTGAGWVGPTSAVKLNPAALSAQDQMPARWDGERFLVAVPNPASTSTVVVLERNRANSTTAVRTTNAHPTGVVRNSSLSYNAVTGDIRVYAVGTSTTVLYYCDYIRLTGVWSSWTSVTATAVLGATGNNYSIRRSSDGNAKFDVLTAHSGAPNTIVHTAQSLSYAPNTPTWDAAAMGQTSGAAADVAATRLLDWVFTDPDPADTQGWYAISRQIGAGALSYWRASDSTWQPAEVQNASATSAITLAAAWAVHTDSPYTFKVKVWDAAGVASSYSDGFVFVPSQKANPTITFPTAAAVLTTDTVTPTWTVSDESAYRLTLSTNPGGLLTYDSGWVTSTALTQLIPVRLPDNSGWTISLQTRNGEGLPSNVATVNFTIDYVEPAIPTTAATPIPGLGVISVTITNPVPGGGQPALSSQDLYRRPVGDTSSGVRVATGLLSGSTYADWGPAHGVAYEYRAVAFGVNGTSIAGAWAA